MSGFRGTRPSLALFEDRLRPFQALSILWEQRLITRKGKAGWLHCARQTYYMMKATDPLLQFAVREAEKRRENLRDFITWARRHADEEREHSRWYREDLRALELDPDEVEHGLPDPHVLRLIGAQFALMAISHPLALLGFFYATECHTPNAARLRACARRLSIPEAALRTMLFHTGKDRRHRQEILALIRSYAQRPHYFAPMLTSAMEVTLGWAALYQDYIERPDKPALGGNTLRSEEGNGRIRTPPGRVPKVRE